MRPPLRLSRGGTVGRERGLHAAALQLTSAAAPSLPPPSHPCPAEEMASGLAQLGYDLAPTEVATLMAQLDIDADGRVRRCPPARGALPAGARLRRGQAPAAGCTLLRWPPWARYLTARPCLTHPCPAPSTAD